MRKTRGHAIRARLQHCDPGEVGISCIVQAELLFGALMSLESARNIERIQNFFKPFVTLSFDETAAVHAAHIRYSLAGMGTPIGPMDVLIAGVARAHGVILVTRNVREFSRVPALLIENWGD